MTDGNRGKEMEPEDKQCTMTQEQPQNGASKWNEQMSEHCTIDETGSDASEYHTVSDASE